MFLVRVGKRLTRVSLGKYSGQDFGGATVRGLLSCSWNLLPFYGLLLPLIYADLNASRLCFAKIHPDFAARKFARYTYVVRLRSNNCCRTLPDGIWRYSTLWGSNRRTSGGADVLCRDFGCIGWRCRQFACDCAGPRLPSRKSEDLPMGADWWSTFYPEWWST